MSVGNGRMCPVTRVAAIDCGTNSIRLLVADVVDGGLQEVERRTQVVRLGEGVDRTGRLAPHALARTLEATAAYAQLCAQHQVQQIRFVATSATRDAENRDDFVSGVQTAIGVVPEVVSGEEEALLSFAGATGALAAGLAGPFCVVDLGGGSTELVLGNDRPQSSWSMDVGSVRLTERHLHSDPPTAAQVEAALADVDAALDEAFKVVPVGSTRTLVGLAGSVTSLTAYCLGLQTYDRTLVDGAVTSIAETVGCAERMLAMTRAQRLGLGFMHPGRADVIGAGALIWAQVVRRIAAAVQTDGGQLTQVVTSEHDILDGIALSIAAPDMLSKLHQPGTVQR